MGEDCLLLMLVAGSWVLGLELLYGMAVLAVWVGSKRRKAAVGRPRRGALILPKQG
jgi:hypothetical protein